MPFLVRSILLLTLGLVWHGGACAQGVGIDSGPQFQVMGFADVKYIETNRPGDEGFELGQAVGHLVGDLGNRMHLFSEVSLSTNNSQTNVEIERLILRYDFSDRAKLSAGRYHTPLGYWNTGYHHGAWLQTSVARPEVVRFGSQIVPIHFVGLLLEGRLLDNELGYRFGVGNGRHSNIARAGDAGDINSDRAWTVGAYGRPMRWLEVGASVYDDRVTPPAGTEIDEQIFSAYALWDREQSEVLLEYHHFDHELVSRGAGGGGNAVYLQFAYRLDGNARALKPYARFERIDVDDADPLLGGRGLDYEAGIAGIRWDFSNFAALKAEYRNESFGNASRDDSFYLQLSVVLATLGGGGSR